MISFSLRLKPESTISLQRLCAEALAAVLGQVDASGLRVVRAEMAEGVHEHGFLQIYPIEPGSGTLIVASNDKGCGSVEFILEGETFGANATSREPGPVLRTRLATLGDRLGDAYALVSQLRDQD